MPTWIYLIKDFDTGYYKIGQSINPLERLKQLKKQTTLMPRPFEFELVDAWRGTVADEKRLHFIFRKQRVRGEWLNLDDADVQDIYTRMIEHPRLSTGISGLEAALENLSEPVAAPEPDYEWSF
jgi:hypothetical protein